MTAPTSGTINVMGTDRDGAQLLLAQHEFEFKSDAITQRINGDKRAVIEPQHWDAFCESCPEAKIAHERATAAAPPSAKAAAKAAEK